MGDIAEMILDGTLCEQCGCVVGDVPEAVGHPRKCEDCQPKKKTKSKKKKQTINSKTT